MFCKFLHLQPAKRRVSGVSVDSLEGSRNTMRGVAEAPHIGDGGSARFTLAATRNLEIWTSRHEKTGLKPGRPDPSVPPNTRSWHPFDDGPS